MPEISAPNQVLLKVHCAALNPLDTYLRQGFLPTRPSMGMLRPQEPFLGQDVAGTIVAIGSEVQCFAVGDRVFGFARGSHAEYALAREQRLAKLPAELEFTQAAAVPMTALTALDALRDVAKVQAGQKVLIYGASGGIGHMAVQLAKHLGAHVTAVCSYSNLEWVWALGADMVLDYSKQDFAKTGIQYDLVYDTVGKRGYWSAKPALKTSGIFIGENPFKARFGVLQMLVALMTKDKHYKMHLLDAKLENLELVASLMQQGKLKAQIEKIYPLEQIVLAHKHIETGRTKGKIVVVP